MTTSGHNVTMREVRIAELKARLSEYLRAVRRGETIAVLDRETPVAQIVPVRDRTALRIRKPAPGTRFGGGVPGAGLRIRSAVRSRTGTIWATGVSRSSTAMVSPRRTARKYSLSRAFSSAIRTSLIVTL